MGGVADPLGIGLEAMGYNPAALAALDGMRLQLTIDPMPNEVTHSAPRLRLPPARRLCRRRRAAAEHRRVHVHQHPRAAPGHGERVRRGRGVLVRALPLVDDQRRGRTSRRCGGRWARRTRWRSPATSAPRPGSRLPTWGSRPGRRRRSSSRTSSLKAKAAIEAEKAKRTATAAKAVRRGAEAARGRRQDRGGPREAARGGRRRQEGSDRREEAGSGDRARGGCRGAGRPSPRRTTRPRWPRSTTWYQAEIAKAQAAYQKKLADLDSVAAERKRLFGVVDDPAQELSPEGLDAAVDTSIAKTKGLLEERTAAAAKRKASFDERRTAQSAAAAKAIEGYETLIDEAVGPRRAELAKAARDAPGGTGDPPGRTRKRTRIGSPPSRRRSTRSRRRSTRSAPIPG